VIQRVTSRNEKHDPSGEIPLNIGDVLGAIMQSGISRSSNGRLQHALGAGSRGTSGGLTAIFGGTGESGGLGQSLSQMLAGSRGLDFMLGNLLGDAGQTVGGKQNLALYGLGALADGLLGGRERPMQGGLSAAVSWPLLALWLSRRLKSRVTANRLFLSVCGRRNQPERKWNWNNRQCWYSVRW
jgi:hypothetical protein